MNPTILKDKYTALWISYSSMTDYIRCPRAYYLKNIYKDPNTNHKISLMQPPLALGQVVHDVLEDISSLPVENRLETPLTDRFQQKWVRVKGIKGGFSSQNEEDEYYGRGLAMMKRIIDSPGPILQKAIKLRQPLPYFWLSEEENIILCGKIDWLEYDQERDGVYIIDFKTSKFDEDPDSLQLPIYCMLANHVQKRNVLGIKYWYLERDDAPVEVDLPNMEEAQELVVQMAKRVQLARKLERFVCKNKDGCVSCRPYELILSGKARHIGLEGYNQDTYVLL